MPLEFTMAAAGTDVVIPESTSASGNQLPGMIMPYPITSSAPWGSEFMRNVQPRTHDKLEHHKAKSRARGEGGGPGEADLRVGAKRSLRP